MNAQFIPEPEPLHEAAEKPGKRLRIARQARGLDQDSVAAHLHLSRAMIQALEQDNYDILPGTVFIRGYIRNYARLLGLDAEPLLKTFAATQPREAEPAPGGPHGTREEPRSDRAGGRLLGAVAVLGAIALLAFWWHNNTGGWTSTSDREPGVASPAASDGDPTASLTTAAVARKTDASEARILEEEAVASPPPTVSDVAETTLRSPSLAVRPTPAERDTAKPPVDAAEAVAAAPPAETTSVAPDHTEAEAAAAQTAPPQGDEATAAAADEDAVVFEFTGPCWVDIRDSTRKFKLFGEMQKGDRHVLGGIPPYSVILGNSPMVKIRVKGTELDLTALSRGNVARFTLDPNSVD